MKEASRVYHFESRFPLQVFQTFANVGSDVQGPYCSLPIANPNKKIGRNHC